MSLQQHLAVQLLACQQRNGKAAVVLPLVRELDANLQRAAVELSAA